MPDIQDKWLIDDGMLMTCGTVQKEDNLHLHGLDQTYIQSLPTAQNR